ncbi:MAG: FAD-dependent oxidoreductase [candidate division WS1 bacterium]|nr:FAD-dependent oxidoreductase [candidate division WS1 bacterium]
MNTYSLASRTLPLDDSWEVIVVGGGPAGSAAATAAAREGAKTLLIEANGALGGMGTLGLVPFFCGYADGEKFVARGLAERVRLEMIAGMPHEIDPEPDWLQFWPSIDPERLKRVYDEMVTEAGVTVLFHTTLASVETTEAGVEALIVANKTGLSALRGQVYVDCTGDGDLAVWAGAEFEKGDGEGNLQPATHCFLLTNVDDYVYEHASRSPEVQAREPIRKALKSGRYPLIVDLHACRRQIGPGTHGFNTGHVYEVDATDPMSVTRALMHGRQQAEQYRAALAEFYPGCENAFLAATGAVLGVRETRRILGDYMLTMQDYLARQSFPDEICRNAYNIDVHGTAPDPAAADKDHETFMREIRERVREYAPGESFGVPYRCLTPRGLRNVLVAGRCISTDRPVNGSVRIMACCLTTGEAAGLAAALAARDSGDVHDIDTEDLRRRLRGYDAYLP